MRRVPQFRCGGDFLLMVVSDSSICLYLYSTSLEFVENIAIDLVCPFLWLGVFTLRVVYLILSTVPTQIGVITGIITSFLRFTQNSPKSQTSITQEVYKLDQG